MWSINRCPSQNGRNSKLLCPQSFDPYHLAFGVQIYSNMHPLAALTNGFRNGSFLESHVNSPGSAVELDGRWICGFN